MSLTTIQRMSERQLTLWMKFAAQRGFPSRRIEAMLARVSLTIAQVNGNKDLTLMDFMLEPSKPKTMKADEGAFALDAIAGGAGVRKLGQGRKK